MLAYKDIQQILSEHEFLKGFSSEHIAKMAGFARLKIVHPGEYLFHLGDPADCCYLVRDGNVAIELRHPSRGPVVIQTAGRNSVLGWSWLIPPYEWRFDCRALELTRGVCVEANRLREACEEDHEFGYTILSRFAPVIADRLEAARIQLLDLYGPGD